MSNIPPPPEGFEPIDDPRQIPPPPPGFELIGEPVPGMEKLGGVPPGPAQPPQAVGAPPPPANRGDFASGLIGGAHGAMSSLGGSVEMAGKLTGSDNLAALGAVIRADQAHKAEAYSKPIADLKNLKTGGDFADWAQYNLGNLLPSMGASTAGAIAGGMVAGPLGAAAGAGLVSYLLSAGEVYSNLREQGVDAPGAAAAAGIPMAMLDAIEPTKIAGKLFFRPVAQAAAKKGITTTLKNVGKRVLTEGLTEGGTEAGQEAIGAATEDLAGGKTEFFSSETLARLLNAAAAGALGGVTMGAIPQRGPNQDPAQPQAQAQAPQATPQGPQATAPPPAPPNAPVAPTAAAVPPGEEVTTEQDTPKPSIQRTVAALDFLGKAEGPITKSALVDALEIGPREANDVLTTLLQQGDIQRTNKGYILTGRTFEPPSPGEEAQPGQQIGILNQALQDPTDEEAPPAAGEAEPEPEPEPPSDPGQPRAPKVEPAYGHNVQIAVPGEETKYPARFAIREAADVYPSHNPMSFEPNPGYEHQNDRDYKDPQNGARVMEYSTPAMFAPDYLIVDNPTAEHGPSIVDPRGNVLGGNNRAMTLRRVYGLSPQASEKYKSTLRSRMERYGIDPAELDRFQHPVLVRERTSAIDAQREITDYNKKASAALRPGEQAVTDGKRMSPRSIAAIVGRLEDAGESGTLADALRGENGAEVVQSLIADGVLTDQEAAGMLEQRGKEQHLTAEAKLRIGKALVGRLFPNAQAFNNTSPEIRNKLERIAPHVVRSEGQKAWGLTEDVRQALDILENLKAHGAKKITVPTKGDALTKFAAPFLQRGWLHKDLSPLVNQKGELTAEGKENLTRLAYRLQEESVLTGQGALEEGKPQQFSPRALAIARTLRLPDKAAAAAFRRYANDEQLSRPGAQGLMFEPPSPEEAFAEAFEAESPVESPVFSRGRKGAHQARKGAFHLARVGGPRYQPGATLAVKSDEAAARVVTERGTPVVMVNGQGWDVLLHAAGMSEGGDANGVLMHPERVQRAIRRLRKGTALRAALDRVDSTQFVPIINTAEHFRDADLEAALTEELDHLEQLNATGEIEHVPLREFFAAPEAIKAAAHLEREVGYEPEPAGMAIEIGVRLMRPGRYVELGLTPEEAVKLADHYVWLLRKRHGDAATRVIVGRVTKAFEDYVRGTEKALQFGHRRSRAESDGVDRGTEARGPPSDARPVDEAERSRQLTLFARQREALARVEGVVAGRLPERASGAQIEGILRSPRNGLKPAELKQSGVLDWLREQRGPIDKTKALSFFAKRRAAVDANQQSLFGDLNPESLEQAEPKKPAPAPKPQRPSGPTMQGGLFDAAEEEASQDATRRDEAALQRDEMQATINSPLSPPKPKPTRRPPTGQGGLFDAQADLFSEPEPVSNDPATAKRIASAFTRAEQDGELPVPLAELRKRAGMDAEAFARAVIRLADEQKLTLTAHDHGGALTDAERRERGLVQDPDRPNRWYVAASFRTPATEAADEYVARIPDAEGEAEARVKKLDNGRFTVTFWDIDTNRKIDEGVRSFDTQEEAVAHARKRFKLDEEPKSENEFQSTQANITGRIAKAVLDAGNRIPDSELAEKGRESQPHVTVLYGLHGQVDAGAVRQALQGERPISLKLGRARIFEIGDADVLYVEVESADLDRLNKKLAALPHTNTHGDYRPHVTIAYLKKGNGAKYVNKPVPGVSGAELTLDRIAFSDRNEQQVEIELTGTATSAGNPANPDNISPVSKFPVEVAPAENPVPGAADPATRLIERIREAIDNGEDIRLKLERIAEEVYGGTRADGDFDKRRIYELQEAAVNGWLADHPELLTMPFEDASARIREVLGRLATQTVRNDEQIRKQQFSTPPHIALLVDRIAQVTPDDIVLEPSAGPGGLVALLRDVAKEVHLNEIDPGRAALAEQIGFSKPTQHDGEIINSLLDRNVKPTVVIMNPPFSAKGTATVDTQNRNKYGWNHLESALQRLAKGGRLVAIMGGGMEGRGQGVRLTAPQAAPIWERLAKTYHLRGNVGIDGKEYAKYGTNYDVRVIVIDKTGPTPGANWQEQLAGIVSGDFATVDEAFNALDGSRRLAEGRTAVSDNTGATGQSDTGGSDVLPVERVPDGDRQPSGGSGEAGPDSGETGQSGSGHVASGPAVSLPPNADSQYGPDGRSQAEPQKARPDGDAEGVSGGSDTPLEIRVAEKKVSEDDAGAFVKYNPTVEGKPHPADIVESKSMSTVTLPPMTYQPKLPASTPISAVQMESVLIAGQQNERRNPDGSRGAALIGDGTGVGKGRTVAAMLLDNWNHGRKRLMWVSENWRLVEDAIRDLNGIGAEELANSLKRLDKLHKKKGPIQHEGVIFATYDLIRTGDTTRRLVEDWLRGADAAEGAFVALDEAHEMKNTVPVSGQPSQIGTKFKELRDNLPNLRTVFMSATAATDVINMGYLERLGLWGANTPFPGGFQQFVSRIGEGGVAAMELVARELKATGRYLARTLSFRGVTHDEVEYKLNEDQKAIYREAAKAWRGITPLVEASVETINGGTQAKTKFMNMFWGAHQRFFDLLLTALKTPGVIELAEQGLRHDKAVVITLVKTNEATQTRQEQKMRDENDEEDEPDFGPKDILLDLIEKHWPVQQWLDSVDTAGNAIKVPATDETGKPILNPQAIEERDELIRHLTKTLMVPSNPLDILIEHFGRENVAELTGRQKYYDAATRTFVKRGGELPRHQVNVVEAQRFQKGEKKVALLSSAAGTGISLHAGNDVPNQRKRLHITLQPGWSADKAMQMLGRTHRTNQKQTPEYKTIVSDLAGEKRFVATIAKRMASLGALTRGTTQGAGEVSAAMEKVNFDSVQGRAAAQSFVNQLLRDVDIPGVLSAQGEPVTGLTVLREMGLLRRGDQGRPTVEGADNVNRLLNRFLALDPDMQNAVFDFYYDIFNAAVQQATEDGTLDTGVKELEGDRVTILESRPLYVDPETRAETYYYKVETENAYRLTSPADLTKAQAEHPEGQFFINSQTGDISFGIEARPIVHANGTITPAIRTISPTSVIWARQPRPAGRTVMDAEAYFAHQQTEAERAVTMAEGLVRGAESTLQNHLQDRARALKDWENAVIEKGGILHVKTPYRKDSVAASLRIMGGYWDRAHSVWQVGKQNEARVRELLAENYTKPSTDPPANLVQRVEDAKKDLAEKQAKLDQAKQAAADPAKAARQMWADKYDAAPKSFTETRHMIGGAVLRWWDTLQGNEGIRLATDTKSGERAVGAVIRDGEIDRVIANISGGRVTVTPSRLYTDVLQNGTEYQLQGGVRVKRGRVAKNPVIELKVPDRETGRVLEGLGVVYEKGVVATYYVPNKNSSTILQRVLAQFPVVLDAVKNLLNDTSGELRLHNWFKVPPAALAKLKNPAKAFAKALDPALVQAALAQVAPLDVRIERQGNGTGKALMDALRRAGDTGEVSAGKRMVKLLAADLDKLTKEERYNLLDALEGRADPVNEKVANAYKVSRALTDEIAAEAEDLEVTVRGHDGKRTFQAMEDYYPHVLRGVDALKSGPVRRDVLENLVRLGIRPDAEAAEEMLDQHIEYMEGGDKIPTKVLDYLVRTGQANNAADALAKLSRMRAHVNRHGSLEYAREVNLPFYDPDPARVLPTHVVGASIRLAQVAELGQDGQVVNRLIRDIATNGGNADWTRRAVDKIIGFANDADEEADKVSRFLRALQGFKLGLAVIPNATQSLNTLLLTDMPSVAKGIRAALTSDGQRYAIETGATLDPVLHETVKELATGSRVLEKFLKATGFSTIERFNRVIAANAGAAYTIRQLRALKADPKNLRARRKLAELGIDVDRAMGRGKITGDELLIASKRLVDASQFRARPQDLPEFASDPWGKVFFQFKSFAYQQTRLVKQAVMNELRDRHWGRGLRNIAILTLLFPLAGEGVRWLRGLLTGRKRDEEGLMRYLDDAAAVGSLGILWDLIEGSRRRKFIETVAGPSAGMAADVLQTLATKPTDPEAWKKLVYRHAPLGSIGRRIMEGPQ